MYIGLYDIRPISSAIILVIKYLRYGIMFKNISFNYRFGYKCIS